MEGKKRRSVHRVVGLLACAAVVLIGAPPAACGAAPGQFDGNLVASGEGAKALEELVGGKHPDRRLDGSLGISTKWASNFAKRSGGAKTAAGAMLVGGVTTMLVFKDAPRIPVTCIGTALAGYAVQLPRGNRLGDSTRQIGLQVSWVWDAVIASDKGRR